MKKVLFLLAITLMTATSYTQTSGRSSSTDNAVQKQNNERNAKGQTTVPNKPQEGKVSPNAGQSHSNQNQPQERKVSPNTGQSGSNQNQLQDKTNMRSQSSTSDVHNNSRNSEDQVGKHKYSA